LSSIPGIGKKTAQRIILELTGKVDFVEEEGTDERVELRKDLVSGLVNLGFTQKGAGQCVDGILKSNPHTSSFESLFKEALRKLSGR
jgi:Holliday junction DNA helicase RuvA